MSETVACLECAAQIEVPADAEAGDNVICPTCGEPFEIVSTEPVEIAPAPELAQWGPQSDGNGFGEDEFDPEDDEVDDEDDEDDDLDDLPDELVDLDDDFADDLPAG